jgi:hypothetical protein
VANTLLNSQIITREALRVLHQKLRFVGSINRQYDKSFAKAGAKIGDTLSVRMPNRYLVTDGAALGSQDTVEKKIPLTVNRQKHVPLKFTAVDLTLHIDDFSKRYIEPAMAVLAAAIEADALTMRSKVWQQVNGMGAAATFRRLMEGRALLEQSLTPDGNRTALLNNLDNVDLVDALKGLFNAQGTISKQNREGMMGHTAGFDFFETTHLNRQARGAGASYLSNGATQSGAAISVDTGTGAINAGEIVTFNGVFAVHPETKAITNQLQQFVVTANYAGGTGVLAISPAIVVTGAEQNVSNAIADNSAMSIAGTASTSYGQSLVYHEDAFTLATADLVLPKGVDFGARENFDGISLRVIRDYDINSDSLPCRVDVLYGYEALRPELAARLAFN